jgi:hypothetical protein
VRSDWEASQTAAPREKSYGYAYADYRGEDFTHALHVRAHMLASVCVHVSAHISASVCVFTCLCVRMHAVRIRLD